MFSEVTRRGARCLAATGVLLALSAVVPGAASAGEPAASDRFTMPRLVGMVLQDAQDVLQSRGSYVLDQEDATGMGRWQLLDSGWKVCRQSPRAGVKVPVEAVVTLWSVKLSERCPR